MSVPFLIFKRFPGKFIFVNDLACGPRLCFRHNVILQRNASNFQPVTMAFTSYGDQSLVDKIPIILMHGLFGSKTNWYSLGKVITKETKKKVFLVDARNHGDSPHTDEHTYLHLAEDIKNFFSVHGIEKAALIGHSMGGRAVMAFALQHPQKMESLSVIDISPIGTPKSMEDMVEIFKAMAAIEPMFGKSLSNARQEAKEKLQKALGSKELSSFLSLNIGGDDTGKFTWKLNLPTLVKSYHPHLTVFPIKQGEFNGPTVFIYGEKSDFLNFKDIKEIKTLFPKASFMKIENAGHWLHAEQPKTFLEIVCNFIKSSKT